MSTCAVDTATPAPPDRRRWAVLAVGTFGVFAALGLARFGYATVLRAMQQDLGFGNTAAGALATANLTGYLVLAVVGGALASRWGARWVTTAGLAVLGVGMILTANAGGFAALCFWRAVTGMGSGAANVAIMGMWPAWFEPRQRGRAAGVAVTGSSFALMLTGLTVPSLLVVPGVGWRGAWLLFGIAALVAAGLAAIVLRHTPAPPAGPSGDKTEALARPANGLSLGRGLAPRGGIRRLRVQLHHLHDLLLEIPGR
ncbi:MAG: MFS transporter [Candidatus Latescibacterota bacterium]|jgi:MFS family permease